MTDRQRFALANPIDPKDDSGLLRFAQTLKRHDINFGTILAVDHNEGFWWHASVSMLSRHHKPVPLSSLTAGERKVVEQVARELLEGVGGPSEKLSQQDKAFHIMRELTNIEKLLLPVGGKTQGHGG